MAIFHYFEAKKTKKLLCLYPSFEQADQQLTNAYLGRNPYAISNAFARASSQESLVDTYGETPLSTFEEMFEKGHLKSSDCFVDLGCGRGRGVFFACASRGCTSIGIDQIPTFCEKAKKIAFDQKLDADFWTQDFEESDLIKGSFFYFYALCLEEEKLRFFISKLEGIKPGSKIVTVSFPLTDYSSHFSLDVSWFSRFPWGKAEVFLHTKKSFS